MSSKVKAVLYVLICVGLWALIPVVSKLGQVSLDNHQFLFWSSLVSFVSFVLATIFAKQAKTFSTYKSRDWLSAILLGFLGTYLYYILLYFGYANAEGLEVLVLQYSWPVFIVLLSIFLLKEKLTVQRTGAIMLGCIGVLVVLTKGNLTNIHLDNYIVDALVIVGALTFALFSVLSKKIRLEPYTLITIYFLTATVASFISMRIFSHFSLPTNDSLVPILINGILVNGYSYVFWIKALREAEASFIAPFVFLTPIISAIYLILFFDEPFLAVYGIGLCAIIISGFLNSIKVSS